MKVPQYLGSLMMGREVTSKRGCAASHPRREQCSVAAVRNTTAALAGLTHHVPKLGERTLFGFGTRLGHLLCGFARPSLHTNPRVVPRFGHGRFFPVHLSFYHSTLCSSEPAARNRKLCSRHKVSARCYLRDLPRVEPGTAPIIA